jgi:hypothetical protein
LFVFLFLLCASVRMRRDRISDYLDFVTDCPGPGMLKNLDKVRGVDLKGNFTAADVVLGDEIQRPVRDHLNKKRRLWQKLFKAAWISSVLLSFGLVMLIIFKSYVLH